MFTYLPESPNIIYTKFIKKAKNSLIFKYLNERYENIFEQNPISILDDDLIFLRWNTNDELNTRQQNDLNKIIKLYKNYYHFEKKKGEIPSSERGYGVYKRIVPLTLGEISKRDYNFRRYGSHFINEEEEIKYRIENTPENIQQKLNQRINEGFNTCKSKINQNFPGNNENNIIFRELINQYYENEYKEELKNRELINEKINNLANKISKRCDKILYGPFNKKFNKFSKDCEPDFRPFYGNKEEIMNEQFRLMKERYLLKQKQKMTLFGLVPFLLPYLNSDCLTQLQVLPFIKIQTFKSEVNICHQSILWSIMSNNLCLYCSLRKNTDIPMSLIIPDNKKKLVPEIQEPLKKDILDKKKFVGVLLIPTVKEKNNGNANFSYIYYYIFFIFSNEKKSQKSYLNMSSSYFTIVNMNGENIDIGCKKETVTTYSEEIKSIYYMYNRGVIHIYYDPETSSYLYLSRKKLEELNENNGNQKYPNLQKVILNKYIERLRGRRNRIYEKNQYIFQTEQQIESRNNNNYLMKTVSRLDSSYSEPLEHMMFLTRGGKK